MSREHEPVPPNQLRRYRHKRNLRLRDIATLIGYPEAAHIAHWEKGRKVPTLKNAFKLSCAIGCPVEVLFLDLFNEVRSGVDAAKRKTNIKPAYD